MYSRAMICKTRKILIHYTIMRNVVAGIAIIGFIGIGVFGIFAMHLGMDHSVQCLASLISNTASCPNGSNILADIVFHSNAFKTFSTALVLFSAILSFGLMVLAFLFRRIPLPTPASPFYLKRTSKSPFFPAFRKFFRWLALKEHSPTNSL